MNTVEIPIADPGLFEKVWYLSATELTEYVKYSYHLSPDRLHLLERGLAYLDQFYRVRRSENIDGQPIPVTASPINQEEGRALMHLAVKHNVKRSLEIGFSFGMSACHLLLANVIVGGETHVAVDPFQLSKYYQGTGLKNVYNLNLGGRFSWISKLGNQALPELLAKNSVFDLMFIDGSHLFGDVFIDAYYGYHLLKPDGLMIFHDKLCPAVRTVANILRANYGFVDCLDVNMRNFVVLKKGPSSHLDWTKFENAFVPFEVAS